MLLLFWPAHLPITPFTYIDRGMKGGGVNDWCDYVSYRIHYLLLGRYCSYNKYDTDNTIHPEALKAPRKPKKQARSSERLGLYLRVTHFRCVGQNNISETDRGCPPGRFFCSRINWDTAIIIQAAVQNVKQKIIKSVINRDLPP